MIKTVLKVHEIKNNPNNPRIIKDDKFKKLVQSIKDFPEMLDTREIVVNQDMVILGGNMRFKAAKEAGLEEVPVKIVDWDDDKQRQFIIKDNVSGGEWDWDVLANEWDVEELDAWGLDTPEGWGEEEPEVVEDEAPEVSDEPPVSKLGEVYQLGRHRVMCGSAIDLDHIGKLLDGDEVDLLLTDPPYNVDYVGKTKDSLKIENDSMSDEDFRQFLTDANTAIDAYMKPGAAFYIFHADLEGFNFRASVKDTGWMLKQCLIWVKQSMVVGRQDYQWKHEPILYGWKEGAAHTWLSDRKQTTVLEFDRPSRNADHPTMKPIDLLAYLIGNSSKKDAVVFDSFSGSGSTMIAAEQTGRVFRGTELDPRYVDVIRKRYWKYVNNNSEEGWQENTPVIGDK